MDMTRLERDSQIRTTAMVVLTFIAVAASLYFLREVLLPFVLALFIGSGLVPVLNAMQKWLESSRAFAVFVTFVLSILLTALIWTIIAFSIRELASAQRPYSAGFKLMLARIGDLAEPLLPQVTEDPNRKELERRETLPADETQPARVLEFELEGQQEAAAALAPELIAETDLTRHIDPKAAKDEALADKVHRVTDFMASRMNSLLVVGVNELIAVLSSGLLVMIFLFFMLLGGSQARLPENNLWRDVDMHVREYIVTKTIISLITGALCGVVLWMFGVPLAFVLGMLVFLLNYIPNLGPIIASLLPVPLVWVLIEATWDKQAEIASGAAIASADDPHMSVFKGVVAIVLVAVIQFVSGNVFETKIMGDQFRLHPIAILLSLMFWYMIWGMVGAFLAVPITSALKIVFAELENTKPVADLLEGNLTILEKRPDQPATV